MLKFTFVETGADQEESTGTDSLAVLDDASENTDNVAALGDTDSSDILDIIEETTIKIEPIIQDAKSEAIVVRKSPYILYSLYIST